MPLPSFSGDIEKNIIRHIKYRGTVRTGEVTADNGDGTYDVKIALSDEIYPDVETIHYEMKFEVGEIAVLAFEYGSKELPKIIGHSKKIAQDPVEVEVGYSGTARVATLDAYSSTSTTAYLEGRITLGGAGNCTRRGFQYGTTTAYGSDTHTDGSYGDGSYAIQVTGLTGETTYHFQAYILDADGDTQTGADKTMTTSELGAIYALIVASPNELQTYDMNGALGEQLAVAGWSYAEAGIAMDSQGNIYTKEWDLIKKYDSGLNLLLTKNIDDPSFYIIAINVGSDGYIYTLENDTPITNIKKRNASDLSIVDTITLTANWSYDGPICLDSDGNIYVFQDPYIEKWSNAGVLLVRIDTDLWMSGVLAGCAVLGNYVYFVKDTNEVLYLPLDLSTKNIWNLPVSIAYSLTVVDNYLILSGWGTGGDGATRKYDSSRNLIWETFLGGSTYAYKAGGYNF